jgi:hypothetical protein
MSRPNLKLAGERSGGSPEREALAAAHLRHSAAVDRLAAIQAARERTDRGRRDAKEAIVKATAGVEQAKIDAASALVGGAPAAITVKGARAALQDAEDALEAAIEAGSTLVASEKEAAAEVAYSTTALDEKLGAVVQTEVDVGQLLAEARAAQDALISKRVQLRYLFNENLIAESETAAVRTFLLFETALPAGRGQVEYGNFDAHPAAATWKEAIAALRTDANAELPT